MIYLHESLKSCHASGATELFPAFKNVKLQAAILSSKFQLNAKFNITFLLVVQFITLLCKTLPTLSLWSTFRGVTVIEMKALRNYAVNLPFVLMCDF